MTDIADALKGITKIVDGLRENTPPLSPNQRQALLAARNHLADVSRSAELAASQLTAVIGDADGETDPVFFGVNGKVGSETPEQGSVWAFSRNEKPSRVYEGVVTQIHGEWTMGDMDGYMHEYPYGSHPDFYTMIRKIES